MLIPSDRPAYRILTAFWGPDDHLYQEGDCIFFDGEPNEDMEPLNELARDRLNAFFDKLDNHARKLAEKAGKEYTGRPRLEAALATARELANAEARQVQLVKDGPGVPLMGAKNKDVPAIGKLDASDTPETGRRGPGRPRKDAGGALKIA